MRRSNALLGRSIAVYDPLLAGGAGLPSAPDIDKRGVAARRHPAVDLPQRFPGLTTLLANLLRRRVPELRAFKGHRIVGEARHRSDLPLHRRMVDAHISIGNPGPARRVQHAGEVVAAAKFIIGHLERFSFPHAAIFGLGCRDRKAQTMSQRQTMSYPIRGIVAACCCATSRRPAEEAGAVEPQGNPSGHPADVPYPRFTLRVVFHGTRGQIDRNSVRREG